MAIISIIISSFVYSSIYTHITAIHPNIIINYGINFGQQPSNTSYSLFYHRQLIGNHNMAIGLLSTDLLSIFPPEIICAILLI